jgi:hypothetical protein
MIPTTKVIHTSAVIDSKDHAIYIVNTHECGSTSMQIVSIRDNKLERFSDKLMIFQPQPEPTPQPK